MNLLVVCLFTLVVGIGFVQCENSLAKYVREKENSYFNAAALDWIGQAVDEQTALTNPKQVGEYLQELLEKVSQGEELAATFEGDRHSLEENLKYLVSYHRRFGPWILVSTDKDVNDYINLVRRSFGTLDVLATKAPAKHPALANYLRHYGKLIVNGAAQRLDDQDFYYLKQEMGMELWLSFEDLFASQGNSSERHMSELAGSLDFVSGRFDAKKMRQVDSSLVHRMDWRRADVLIEFIGRRCDRFLELFKTPVNNINMYRMLNPNGTTYHNLNKYSEYGRLCYQFTDPETSQQVHDNIKKQLATTVSKLVDSVKGATSS